MGKDNGPVTHSKDTGKHNKITSRILVKDTSRIQVKDSRRIQVSTITERHLKLIKLVGEEWISAADLRSYMGFKSRSAFVNNYISPLYENGILILQQPDAPNSPTQKYGLSVKGKAIFYTGNLSIINAHASSNSTSHTTINDTSNNASNNTSKAKSKHINKLTYIELSKLIIAVSTTWKSAQEISISVSRSAQHIRSNILPRMVKDEYLEMLEKENPNSPLQKYRATKRGRLLL